MNAGRCGKSLRLELKSSASRQFGSAHDMRAMPVSVSWVTFSGRPHLQFPFTFLTPLALGTA